MEGERCNRARDSLLGAEIPCSILLCNSLLGLGASHSRSRHFHKHLQGIPHNVPPHVVVLITKRVHPLPISSPLAAIHSSGVIACLCAQSGELAMEDAQAALDGGISVLEITMTTPDVFEVLQELVQQYPSSILGVGTVLNSTVQKVLLRLVQNSS